jgi:hypothetical protein
MFVSLIDKCYINMTWMSINNKKALLGRKFRLGITFEYLLKPYKANRVIGPPILWYRKVSLRFRRNFVNPGAY